VGARHASGRQHRVHPSQRLPILPGFVEVIDTKVCGVPIESIVHDKTQQFHKGGFATALGTIDAQQKRSIQGTDLFIQPPGDGQTGGHQVIGGVSIQTKAGRLIRQAFTQQLQ